MLICQSKRKSVKPKLSLARFTLMSVLMLMASGCSTTPLPPPVVSLPPIPANLASKCPSDLATPLVGMDGAALTNKLLEAADTYNDCRDRHNTLVDYLNSLKK